MNTESQQQIARKAAERLWDGGPKEELLRANTGIILSAIERATEHLYKLLDEQGAKNWGIAAQPQRSEQQDWTQDDNCLISPTGQSFALNDRGTAGRLKQAITAALTAEREKLRLMTDNRNFLIGQRDTARNETAELEQQLTAERQRREQTWNNYQELRQQLLSALAAIEKHNKECDDLPYLHPSNYKIPNVDLSLLHEHDRKEQKPLVDALEMIRSHPLATEWMLSVCDDALAKIQK